MAIDGTKIIDSDLGHDVYNEFMDLYDAGVDVVDIRKKIDVWREDVLNEEEFEIFITVYAFALWEIGNLDKKTLNEVGEAISRKAGYTMWLNESGPAEAKARERVLDRFFRKISAPKQTPRKRRPFKPVSNPIFEENDVVSFQMPDGSYRAAIMAQTEVLHRKLVYFFAKLSFIRNAPATEVDIRASSIFIHKLQTSYSEAHIKSEQPGIEKFWRRDNASTHSWMLSMSYDFVAHSDLVKFSDKMKIVTKFKILKGYKRTGCFGYRSDFESFSSGYENLSNEVSIWKREPISLTDIEDRHRISIGKRLISKITGGN